MVLQPLLGSAELLSYIRTNETILSLVSSTCLLRNTAFIGTCVHTVHLNMSLRPNITVEDHNNVRDQIRYNRVALQSPATMSCVINLVELLGREHPGVCVIDQLGIAFCKCLDLAFNCVITCRQPCKAKATSVLRACTERMTSTSPSYLSMASTSIECPLP